jgi:hypothetical protein
MKKIMFSYSFKKKQSDSVDNSKDQVSFIVVDDVAKLEASRAISKVKMPAPLRAIEDAYVSSNSWLKKLSRNDIQIVQKKNLTKDEAYQQNVSIFNHLIEQRNAIVGVIESMVQPLINNAAKENIRQSIQDERIIILERQVLELTKMLNAVYGKSPGIPPLPGGKMPWGDSMKKAADEIIKIYDADAKAEKRNYRTLRDASDEFFDRYKFIYKPEYTKVMLYENVRKAKSSWQNE